MKQPISNAELTELAQTHGTPMWVYDAESIRSQINKLRAFDVIRYAQKACSNIHILRLMRNAGVRVDAVSLGEIERAVTAGFTPDSRSGNAEIVFTADVFDRETLQRVIDDHIEVNAGSIDMLEQLGSQSPGHRVWLRINPGFGHGHSQKTNTGGENSKHGIWHAELARAIEVVRKNNLYLVGIHLHIGSGVDYEHLQRVCSAMIDIVLSMDYPIEAISAGGGLSVPYRDGEMPIDTEHYFGIWDQGRRRIEERLGKPVRLEIEPGRFLVAEAGILISEVRATKKMGSNYFTLVDAGFNDLMRPSLYGSYHKISVISRESTDCQTINMQDTVIAGPLCESGDVFTQRDGGLVETRSLPMAKVGDLVVFHTAGAYGASMSSNYNSRPYAAEVLLDGNEYRLIRRRQTLKELLSLEIL
ncbi:MAG: hypothetical protein RLY71_2235 [Pseudomonadota bacterium]|jgi:diaminopimelate decarboxylase